MNNAFSEPVGGPATQNHRQFIDRLLKREQWLTEEISRGGNFDHLNARRSECAYIRSLLEKQCSLDSGDKK